MRNDHDDNYVSTGEWMLLMLIPSIPIICWIAVLVLAFTGSNQTRKNYFRAILAWILLVIVLIAVLGLVCVAFPPLFQELKDWKAKHP